MSWWDVAYIFTRRFLIVGLIGSGVMCLFTSAAIVLWIPFAITLWIAHFIDPLSDRSCT